MSGPLQGQHLAGTHPPPHATRGLQPMRRGAATVVQAEWKTKFILIFPTPLFFKQHKLCSRGEQFRG